jgi:hyperosmotically inducible protein
MMLKNAAIVVTAVSALWVAGCNRSPDSSPQRSSGAADTTRGAAQATDDAGITAKVKTALIAQSELNSKSIDVDTQNGVVTLSGTVPEKVQVERAAQVAQTVGGVKRVDNRLTVGS